MLSDTVAAATLLYKYKSANGNLANVNIVYGALLHLFETAILVSRDFSAVIKVRGGIPETSPGRI